MKREKSIKGIFQLCGLLILTLPACSDNLIYFEILNQELVSCNGKMIKAMSIENLNEKEYYVFQINFSPTDNLNRIDLNNIPSHYQIKKNGVLLSNKEFSLSGNSTFLISNYTFGDATSSDIKVITNSSGQIVEASIKSCD